MTRCHSLALVLLLFVSCSSSSPRDWKTIVQDYRDTCAKYLDSSAGRFVIGSNNEQEIADLLKHFDQLDREIATVEATLEPQVREEFRLAIAQATGETELAANKMIKILEDATAQKKAELESRRQGSKK